MGAQKERRDYPETDKEQLEWCAANAESILRDCEQTEFKAYQTLIATRRRASTELPAEVDAVFAAVNLYESARHATSTAKQLDNSVRSLKALQAQQGNIGLLYRTMGEILEHFRDLRAAENSYAHQAELFEALKT